MAESIKDKIAIIGMGCTQFGELWDQGIETLMEEATFEALEDAGLDLKDIQAAWLGTTRGGFLTEGSMTITGLLLSSTLQLQYIPVTHVENACGTGAEALRGAAYALAAKVYDIVLAIGVDKLKDAGFGGLGTVYPGKWHPVYGVLGTGPGRYAMAATAYFAKYGLSILEGKKLLASISVKSHHYGAHNPKAHLRIEVTVDQVVNAPIIAYPLGIFDCCGVTDGAAAAIMCRVEDAKKIRNDYITIKGFGIGTGPGWGKERVDYDFTSWEETEAAARLAYQEAGIKNPRKELDMVENHDCFSIAELIASESLFLCEKGKFKEQIADTKANWKDGDIPTNISGGLKSFGHPIGASGCREVYEIYKQIQGKAQEPYRQIPNVQLGLAHNQGGHPGRFACGITIVGAP